MEELLFRYFGYKSFKPFQKEIINDVISGKDCISILPTGYGKSLIFQMLSIINEGITIVISPLIALMEDQKRNLDNHNINVEIINSNMNYEQQLKVYKKIVRNNVKLIYVSPERLLNYTFQSFILKQKISLIVVDEAHTILWGDSFRTSFLKIGNFLNLIGYKPTILAVTATATSKTIDKIKMILNIKDYVLYKESVIKENIFYSVKKNVNKIKFIKQYLYKNKEKTLIYCLTRKKVEYLYNHLKEYGYRCCYYHGGLDVSEKKKNQDMFTKNLSRIMICTNAFGMGIDIYDIRHVIHYEIPASIEDLVQQSGRASRDGKRAYETILFSFDDIKTITYFHEELDNDIKQIEKKKLNDVISFCLSNKCRHQLIGKYFNEKVAKCKNNCDVCKY